MAFTGIPAEAFEFYDALTADNSRTFWADHKHEYEQFVRSPVRELMDALEPEFGQAHLFRPYRDLRFSADKTPYKDHQGAYVEGPPGLGRYLQVSVTGLRVAAGWYRGDREQLTRYRTAVTTGGAAPGVRELLEELRAAGYRVDGDRLKTKPRGFAADDPNVDLLRHRSLYLWRAWDPAPWMGEPTAADAVAQSWRITTPLLNRLADIVGPPGES